MNDDMSKYHDAYLSEARTLVKGMNLTLIEWEIKPSDKKCLQDIFRMAHTLKSISAAMGYQHVSQLSHAIEDLLDAIREDRIKLTDCTNHLFNCFDFLEEALKALTEEQPELDSKPLIQNLRNLLTHEKKPSDELTAPPNAPIETINTIEVKVERLDKLLNLTKELLVNKMKLETLSELIQSPELTTTVDIVNRAIRELQYHVMQIRLVPIEFVFGRFVRMIRDLAKQQKKEVHIETLGGSIELDRSLIDGVSEALAHLIKNAIDHGLETPKARQDAKKYSSGKIELSARKERDVLIIEVSDDGTGLNMEAIKKNAVQRKILKPSAGPEEVKHSIFKGVSTCKKVTDISGRGLGLSIVKQKIESINGTIHVKTEAGKGTKFIVEIPLTLAVIFVLLVKHADHTYAIPLSGIERLMTVASSEIKSLINREAIIYNNKNIPILRLSTLFNEASNLKSDQVPIVILRKDGKLVGLIVDSLLTTEEIITQPINTMVRGSKFFSGTALLGSGDTILILDIEQLFLSLGNSKKNKNISA